MIIEAMELKLDRLLDEELKYSYRDFYYQTKSVLFSKGIKISVNVHHDLLQGLLLVRKDGSKIQINSINQLICSTLFNFCPGLYDQNPKNAVEILVSQFFNKDQIPLFSKDEAMEISIWSKDESKKVEITINNTHDLVLKLSEMNLTDILKESIDTKVLKFKIKVLSESESRKSFEKVLFENLENELKNVFYEKMKNDFSLMSTPEMKHKMLAGVYQCNLDSIEEYFKLPLKSVDRVLFYFSLTHGFRKDGTIDQYILGFERNCRGKLNMYNKLVDIITGESLDTVVYLNPSR